MYIGAKAMVARILSDGQTPSVWTYQKLMEGFAQHGDAEEICNLMEQRQLKMDRFMLSYLIKAYLKRYIHLMKFLIQSLKLLVLDPNCDCDSNK